MAWKSSTFKKSESAGRTTAQDAISRAVAKHRDAMSGVISDAKKLADERRRTLDRIQDPELKRSAAL
jgi:cytochrome c556